MGESFGVIPLSTLQRYKGPETKNRTLCNPLELHKLVKQFGCPNFLGACILVISKLKIDNWKFHLKDYWDKQLLDLLEFGFPLDFDTNTVLTSTEENHASATQFFSHVETYIKEEIKHGAILGPFEHKPIDLHVSPFMTRDKPNTALGELLLVAPTTSMVCLRISIDTKTRTMSVPPEKLENIIHMCTDWQNKKILYKTRTTIFVGISSVCVQMRQTSKDILEPYASSFEING